MSGEHGDIHRYRRGAPPGQVVADWERRAAVLSDEHGGDALRDLRDRLRIAVEPLGRVIVDVDESGRHHQTCCIEHTIVWRRRDRPDAANGVPFDADIDASQRAAAPVGDLGADDRPVRRLLQGGNVVCRDVLGEALGLRLREVREHHDGEIVAEIAGDVGLESLPRAAMSRDLLACQAIDVPPEAVGMAPAAVQADRLEDRIPALRLQDGTRPQPPVPGDVIAQRQVEGPVSRRIERGRDPLLVPDSESSPVIPGSPVRHDLLLADHARRGHAERREHPIAEDVAVERPRRLAHHSAEQGVARVAVLPLIAGREVERHLVGHLREFVFAVVAAVVQFAVGVVGNARRVREQMANGDGLPARRPGGEELLQRIGERQLAILDQQHDRRRRELLADRPRLEDGAIGDGHLVLEIGDAIAFRRDHLAAPHDRHGDAGNALLFHVRRDDRVNRIARLCQQHGGTRWHEQAHQWQRL